LNTVAGLFPWVDIIFFSELCISGLDMNQAMPIPNPTLGQIIDRARKNKKWIIPGSVYEKEKYKIYNTSLVISPKGKIVAKYRKFSWHLFVFSSLICPLRFRFIRGEMINE